MAGATGILSCQHASLDHLPDAAASDRRLHCQLQHLAPAVQQQCAVWVGDAHL